MLQEECVYLPTPKDETGRHGFIRRRVKDLTNKEQEYVQAVKELDGRNPDDWPKITKATEQLFLP